MYIPRIMNNKWVWILLFSVAVAIYLILDILHMLLIFRQILLWPIILFEMLIYPFLDDTEVLCLDVDIVGIWATCIRTLSFGIELGVVLLPCYFYRKTKKKVYLFLMLLAIAWIIVGLCYFLIAFLSISGMMD